ncbi:carboxyl transferase domain-containing protein [Streptomyces sp. NPDC005474]|uniref:carboxyl transferase domain-containing protein n=1 Tax=Streptomyces sp. NPDC005474 TaxID=3154878 RepID=UPI003456AEB4
MSDRAPGRLSAREIIALLCDSDDDAAGGFVELPCPTRERKPDGPLAWRGYDASRARAAARTGEEESVVCGTARVGGTPAVLIAFEFGFLGGSLGERTGDRLELAYTYARTHRLPVVPLVATGGSRMQEGMLALTQLQRVARQSALTREAGLPQIAVLRDPTTGGGWATLGASADVVLALTGAQVGFAGSRVRPTDADPAAYTAEAQVSAGAADAVVRPEELRETLALWLRLLSTGGGGAEAGATEFGSPEAESAETESTEAKSADAESPEAGSPEPESAETGSTDTESPQAESPDARPADARSTDARSTDAAPPPPALGTAALPASGWDGSPEAKSTDTGSPESGSPETGSTDAGSPPPALGTASLPATRWDGSPETESPDAGSPATGSTETRSTETGSTDAVPPPPALGTASLPATGWDGSRQAESPETGSPEFVSPDARPPDAVPPPPALGTASLPATGWDAVQRARSSRRPRAGAYLDAYFTRRAAISGDRCGGTDAGMVCGFGERAVDGRTVAYAAQLGTATRPAGYRTAARLIRLAGRLGIPVLTLVDTPGAANDADAERQGAGAAIADLFGAVASARTPVTTLLIGEGGSGGALALAAPGNTWATPDSYFSVIAPELAAAILKRPEGEVEATADQLRIRPQDLVELGVVRGIVGRPDPTPDRR